MTKDKLAVILALLIQAGAIIWWASKIDTTVKDLARHYELCNTLDKKIEKLEMEINGNKSR